jgi:hypothetical protein
MQKVGSVSITTLKARLRKSGFVDERIILQWPKIVGNNVAKYAKPAKVTFQQQRRCNGTLHVNTIASYAFQIQQREQQILDAINKIYGYGAIKTMQLHQQFLTTKS